ncbi:MAG: DegV family protein [Paenibacillaceae bacterium]
MARVKIVTDSTADLPLEIREKLGIEMVPLKVHFGEETFYDSVDINSSEFYQKLGQSNELPTTSQPSPVDFMDIYKEICDQPETSVLSIHLSAALSGTYQSAMLAKSLLENQSKVVLVDSKSACYGLGLLVIAAAEAAQAGKSMEEIQALVMQLRKKTRIYFIVDTLEYLYKGGRIGKASAMFGSLLNIKPILTVDSSGEVDSVDKVRGHKKALRRIIELLQKEFEGQSINVCIGHSEASESAEEMFNLINDHFQVNRHSYTHIGPVIGTHVGAGAIAVFVTPSA